MSFLSKLFQSAMPFLTIGTVIAIGIMLFVLLANKWIWGLIMLVIAYLLHQFKITLPHRKTKS